jgi:hypothetical protein
MAQPTGLPTGTKDLRWPPDSAAPAYSKYAEHSAWYSGDVQKLAEVYVGMGSPGAKPQGLVNVVRSWFWGKQAIAPATRVRIHVPMAADIASTSADLLFSEAPTFAVDGNVAIQKRLDGIVEQEYFTRLLLEAAEVGSALGGVFFRATWDEEVVPDHPILTVVHPDAVVPEFRYGRLFAATLWQVVDEGDGITWRKLERHERGYIFHGLYRGTKDKLGEAAPLTDHPSTAGIVDSLTGSNYIETGVDALTVAYVPNMLPNRLYRGSELGRSDYAGAEILMDALDETYTSWMRDLRLGRGRIILPAEYLRTMPNSKGQGGWFDVEQEAFVGLDGMPPGESPLTLNQFKIRTDEHSETALALLERIVSVAGYSASSFGLNGDQESQTATEVESRERRSFITRDKKAQYWAPALRDILTATLALDKVIFGGPGSAPIQVTITDSVREDPSRRATAVELIARAGAASTETLVRMTNPKWSDSQVKAEVLRIQNEKGMLVPDPAGVKPPSVSTGPQDGQDGGKTPSGDSQPQDS